MRRKQKLKLLFATIVLLSLLTSHSLGQDSAKEIVVPIRIDRSVMSGLGLKAVKNASQPDRKLFQKRLYAGPDISVYVVASETASATHENYAVEEVLYLLNGRARLNPTNGKEHFFNTGEFFVAPKGFSGEWETLGGRGFLRELSVITTKRTKDEVQPGKLPVVFEKAKLSGIGISNSGTKGDTKIYRDEIYSGSELAITLLAEEPQIKVLEATMPEQLIYVVSGSLTLTPSTKEGQDPVAAQTFLTGDFFVLPAGFHGHWESKALCLCRTLQITKAK